MKDIKVFVMNKKKKRDNMVMNDTQINQKTKNKSLLSIEKDIIKLKKGLIKIIRNCYLKK